jgi:cob(I)alamin adenosyltransferase
VYNRSLLERAVTEVRGKDVLVLDELLVAVSYGFIPEERVLVLLSENRERLEIVMTGRRAPEALLSEADYVSEIVKRAHPYDRGIRARMGIEY